MQVRDIMNPHVVSIDPTESAALAARLLARHNVGSLPVRVWGQLQGMVTDRDIVLRCVAAEEDPRSVPVRSIMSRRPAVVTPEDDVRQAARLMSSQQVRRLPVVDKDRVVGVVSWGTWPSAAAMRWRFPGPLPTSPRTSVSPLNRGPRGKTTVPPAAPVSYACSTRVRILQAWSQASPGVLPEQLLEAGVRGGLRAGEIGGHGGLLLGKPPAESPLSTKSPAGTSPPPASSAPRR